MKKKTIVIAGASGIVGQAISKALHEHGYTVRVLSTRPSYTSPFADDIVVWNPALDSLESSPRDELVEGLDGCFALINLAGKSIADGRFSHLHKTQILESRLQSTQTLGNALKACEHPPGTWIQASAIGFYGSRGDEELREESPSGELYLSKVCRLWEAAAQEIAAQNPSLRLVVLRLGMVLDAKAPGWKELTRPIRLGVGGPLGIGSQWVSWVSAIDVARMVLHLLQHPENDGIWNAVSPGTLRQKDMVQQIGRALSRPTLIRTPAWALRLALGGMADELVLPSARVVPQRFLRDGFTFTHPSFAELLPELLT